MAWYRNYYKCARCGRDWPDEWSRMCDDDCPIAVPGICHRTRVTT
jgi:hypothetical protein